MSQYEKLQPETIQTLFNAIAPGYDLTNKLMSFNQHARWNKALIKTALKPYSPKTYIDLCAGTGEIAYNFLKHESSPCQATLVDFSKNMLEVAKSKQKNCPDVHSVHFVQADVQNLPFEEQSADAMTIAYGIRNVQEPLKCFKEVFRVLKPGGSFGILELTRPNNQILRLGHSLYLRYIIPLLGKLVTRDRLAYQYLCNSIESFSQPKELVLELRKAGFNEITVKPLHFGIATLIHAKK